MDFSPEPYPGSVLTINQLAHALSRKINQEYSSSVSIRADFNLQKLSNLETSLIGSLAGLRAFKNAFSPISRLHTETLARIFGFVAHECREASPGNWDGPYDWINITHVCRYWRATAMSFPSLWSTVDSTRPRIARRCMELSKFAPLYILLDSGCPEDILLSVKENMDRVHSLFAKKALPSMLAHFAQVAAPKLQNLALERHSGLHQFSPLFRSHTPSLKILHLYGFSLSQPVPHIIHLVELTLYNDIDNNNHNIHPMSMARFLDILEANHGLKVLKIYNSGPRLGEEQQTSSARRVVRLDNLRLLDLCCCAIQPILGSIYLPPIAKLVAKQISENEQTRYFIRDNLPQNLTQLQNLQGIEVLGLDYISDNRGCSLRGLGPQKETGRASFSITSTGLPCSLAADMLRKFQPLEIAGVKSLWLRDVEYPVVLAKPGHLGTMLHAMPNLENLVVMGGTVDGLFQALKPSDDETIPCPCPRLRSLTIYDVQNLQCSEITKVVIARNLFDMPLQSISVIYHPAHTFSRSTQEMRNLKKYVNTVEFKLDYTGPEWPFS